MIATMILMRIMQNIVHNIIYVSCMCNLDMTTMRSMFMLEIVSLFTQAKPFELIIYLYQRVFFNIFSDS